MRTPLALAALLSVGLLSTQLKAEDQKPAQPGAPAPAAGAEKQPAGRVNAKLEAQNYKSYIVQDGDSLWELAKRNGVDFNDLYRLNRTHLRNPSRIQAGDKIYLPEPKKQAAAAETAAPAAAPADAKPAAAPAKAAPAEAKPAAAEAKPAAPEAKPAAPEAKSAAAENKPAGKAGSDAFTGAQKSAIRKIIKEYLLSEPEVLREAINELNKRQEQAAEAERKKVLASLYKEKSPYSTGEGKITLVEFFDYNCPYCRHALDNVLKFTKEEKDVRVIFVEFPILSDDSRVASQAAIAAAKQNKYFEFHRALMQHQGPVKEDVIYKTASEIGLDVNKLKADMKSPEVKELIEKNLQLGTSMGVQGTPAFFIGDEAIPGAPEELRTLLKNAVASIKSKGCSIC
jgi:protein-disulfide isomerase